MVFHDPPAAMGYPDPRTNELELHNTWLVSLISYTVHPSRSMWHCRESMYSYCILSHNAATDVMKTDVSKRYIDWAVKNDFAAIDVNIPKFYTGLKVSVARVWGTP